MQKLAISRVGRGRKFAEASVLFSLKHHLSIATLGFFACVYLIYVVVGMSTGGRMAFDEQTFHWPAIQHFAQGGAVTDYSSATTPGYHLLMAALAHVLHLSLNQLRAAGALITAVLFFCIAYTWTRNGETPIRAWLALPALSSIYMLPSGVWLLPDNLAWFSVWATLFLCTMQVPRQWHFGMLALCCATAVFVRQSNAWVIAPALLFAWAAPGYASNISPVRRLFTALAVIAPAIGVLFYFIVKWQGLVPPSFQKIHQSVSLIAPAWLLVQFFAAAVFYVPLLTQGWRVRWEHRSTKGITAMGAFAGLCLAAIDASTFSLESGRWSGLWQLTKVFPSISDRSVFVLACSALGGAILAFCLTQVRSGQRLTIAASILGFSVASASNHYVFDKYFVGFLWILMPIIATSYQKTIEFKPKHLLGPFLLFILNAAVLVSKIS